MEITGTFIKNLPETRGEGQRGPWVRGGFVIEYGDEYPRKLAFTLFGEEKVQMAAVIQPGTAVTVRFNPESREYQDKWFSELRCTSVMPVAQAGMYPQQQYQPQQYAQQQRQAYQQPVAQTYQQQPAFTRPTGGPQPLPQQPMAQSPVTMPEKDPDLPF